MRSENRYSINPIRDTTTELFPPPEKQKLMVCCHFTYLLQRDQVFFVNVLKTYWHTLALIHVRREKRLPSVLNLNKIRFLLDSVTTPKKTKST